MTQNSEIGIIVMDEYDLKLVKNNLWVGASSRIWGIFFFVVVASN